MSIEVNHIQNVVVISPKGKIMIGEGDIAIQSKVENLLDEGHRNIVANLEGVTFMDSSGVGTLVTISSSVSGKGGNFKLCALNSNVFRLAQMAQLTAIFEIFDTEQQAINSF